MNASSARHDPAIDARAAHWAARLDGETLHAHERADLDAWLAQSPAHRAALSDYCQLSADLEEQLPKLVASGAFKLPAPTPRPSWSFPRLAAVTLAAAAVVTFAVWLARPAAPIENFASTVAQRPAFTLADGTRVELNANTSLRFENNRTERRVQLAGGEAVFTVTKDRARPFIVETPAGSVRVTGTIFNVRTGPAATAFEVTVVEGSVEARPGIAGGARPAEGVFPLGAGDQLLARAEGVAVKSLSAAALEDALAWRRGLAVFNDVALRDAAARFSRYHGRAIAVDPAIADERIGGQFSLDDFEGFLRGMESALGVVLTYDQNRAARLSPRRAP